MTSILIGSQNLSTRVETGQRLVRELNVCIDSCTLGHGPENADRRHADLVQERACLFSVR